MSRISTPERLALPAGGVPLAAEEARPLPRERGAAWVESALAGARAVLAVFCLSRTAPDSHVLFAAQIAFLLFALVCLAGPGYSRVAHGADLAWALAVAAGNGPARPEAALAVLFVLTGAAARWGLRETLATGVACAFGLLAGAWRGPAPQSLWLALGEGAGLLALGAAVALVVAGHRRAAERAGALGRTLLAAQAQINSESGVRTMLEQVRLLYRAPRILAVSHESAGRRRRVWWLPTREGADTADRTGPLVGASAWHASLRGSGVTMIALDAEGREQEPADTAGVRALLQEAQARAALSVGGRVEGEWSWRVVVFDPDLRGADRADALRAALEAAGLLGDALRWREALRRVRVEVGARERARVARELHDGAIQTLIGVEMEVEVLRRRAQADSSELAGSLGRIHRALRAEVLELRELMERMRPLDVGPDQLVGFLDDIVARFERDSGINSRFVCELERVPLPATVCREVARVVQEALVNVRKHSGAKDVVVRLKGEGAAWRLEIDDDGGGFGFSGRFTLEELEAARKGPLVIKERVRAMGGQLVVESYPGAGARLTIALPRATDA